MRKHGRAATWFAMVCLVVATSACRLPAPERWRFAETATGRYVAEFLAEPTVVSIPATTTRLLQLITYVDFDDTEFLVSELDLGRDDGLRPLDVTVESTISDMQVQLEEASGHGQKVTHLTTTTGDFEGVESRTVECRFLGEIVTSVTFRIFSRHDALVRAIVMSTGADQDPSADRFLESLRSNTASDRV